METEKQSSSLPGIRTLAKDLARSSTSDTSITPPAPPKPAQAAITMAGTGESRVYQAPTIKKLSPSKVVPVPTENETGVPVPPQPPKDETKLKPLSGPKIAEETMIVVGNEDAASATIIRDTKRGRFRLFPAISASLTAWAQSLKERYFTKKAPKYTVPETTRRKGVIQKATSKTGKLNTFDNTSLHARIKAREERALPKKPSTTWTANTEPGFALLEAPEVPTPTPTITNIQVVPRKSYRTPSPAPLTPLESVHLEAPKVPAPILPRIIVASETEPIINPPETKTPEVSTPAPTQPIVVVATTQTNEQPELRQTPLVTQLRPASLREWLFTLNTNLVALAVVSVVVGLSIFGTVIYGWYSERASTITVTTVPNHPAIISAPVQLLFSPELSRQALTTTLLSNQTSSGPEVLQFAFTTSAAGETLLSPQQVMSIFGFKASGPFVQSLNAVYFGSMQGEAPFVVMKTTDKNTAFGGMLNWEPTLYDDLRPILRIPELPVTDDLVFKDVVLNNVDTRALTGADGAVYLIYNQPKDGVLFITNSSETLVRLLPLTK